MFDNVKLYFPFIANDVVSYYEKGKHELILKLKDGTSVSYDDYDRTIRNLPSDSYNMSEKEFKIEFGIRLSRLMHMKGITQMDISNKTGIPQPMISSYITGRNLPSFYKVDKLAKALGCSMEDLRYTD